MDWTHVLGLAALAWVALIVAGMAAYQPPIIPAGDPDPPCQPRPTARPDDWLGQD